jgi:exocyst complex component 2
LNLHGLASKSDTKDGEKKGSIFLTRDDFDPELFLSIVHKDTPYSKLEDGQDTLETKIHNRTEALKILVRDNFAHFVSCKDTIDTIHEALIKNEEGRTGNSLQLYVTYTGIVQL